MYISFIVFLVLFDFLNFSWQRLIRNANLFSQITWHQIPCHRKWILVNGFDSVLQNSKHQCKKHLLSSHLGEWRASGISDYVTSNLNNAHPMTLNSQVSACEAPEHRCSASRPHSRVAPAAGQTLWLTSAGPCSPHARETWISGSALGKAIGFAAIPSECRLDKTTHSLLSEHVFKTKDLGESELGVAESFKKRTGSLRYHF